MDVLTVVKADKYSDGMERSKDSAAVPTGGGCLADDGNLNDLTTVFVSGTRDQIMEHSLTLRHNLNHHLTNACVKRETEDSYEDFPQLNGDADKTTFPVFHETPSAISPGGENNENRAEKDQSESEFHAMKSIYQSESDALNDTDSLSFTEENQLLKSDHDTKETVFNIASVQSLRNPSESHVNLVHNNSTNECAITDLMVEKPRLAESDIGSFNPAVNMLKSVSGAGNVISIKDECLELVTESELSETGISKAYLDDFVACNVDKAHPKYIETERHQYALPIDLEIPVEKSKRTGSFVNVFSSGTATEEFSKGGRKVRKPGRLPKTAITESLLVQSKLKKDGTFTGLVKSTNMKSGLSVMPSELGGVKKRGRLPKVSTNSNIQHCSLGPATNANSVSQISDTSASSVRVGKTVKNVGRPKIMTVGMEPGGPILRLGITSSMKSCSTENLSNKQCGRMVRETNDGKSVRKVGRPPKNTTVETDPVRANYSTVSTSQPLKKSNGTECSFNVPSSISPKKVGNSARRVGRPPKITTLGTESGSVQYRTGSTQTPFEMGTKIKIPVNTHSDKVVSPTKLGKTVHRPGRSPKTNAVGICPNVAHCNTESTCTSKTLVKSCVTENSDVCPYMTGSPMKVGQSVRKPGRPPKVSVVSTKLADPQYKPKLNTATLTKSCTAQQESLLPKCGRPRKIITVCRKPDMPVLQISPCRTEATEIDGSLRTVDLPRSPSSAEAELNRNKRRPGRPPKISTITASKSVADNTSKTGAKFPIAKSAHGPVASGNVNTLKHTEIMPKCGRPRKTSTVGTKARNIKHISEMEPVVISKVNKSPVKQAISSTKRGRPRKIITISSETPATQGKTGTTDSNQCLLSNQVIFGQKKKINRPASKSCLSGNVTPQLKSCEVKLHNFKTKPQVNKAVADEQQQKGMEQGGSTHTVAEFTSSLGKEETRHEQREDTDCVDSGKEDDKESVLYRGLNLCPVASDNKSDDDFETVKPDISSMLNGGKKKRKRKQYKDFDTDDLMCEEVDLNDLIDDSIVDFDEWPKRKKKDGRGRKKIKLEDYKPENLLVKCRYCDFNPTEEVSLKMHTEEHHPVMKCEFCPKKFRVQNCLFEHLAKYHTGIKYFKCQHEGCDYSSKNRTDLGRHQAKHATERSHVCQLCGWKTKWRRNLRMHHYMVHEDKRPFRCDICSFTCKRNTDLKQHMVRHSDYKPLKCQVCGFRVKTNWELRSHSLTHTNEKPFKCTFPGCTGATKTRADLVKHMTTHKIERDFICDICQRGYKTKGALKKHKEYMHTDGVKFTCDTCGKQLKCKVSLRKHMELHSGPKPFVCEICGMRFQTRSNRRQHMVTHNTAERPYICPLCPHAAKQPEHLLTHIGTMHGNHFAYFCELCKKPFKRYTMLRLHYQRMHSKKEVENMHESHNVDLALLKMEMQLDEDELAFQNKKKKDRNVNQVADTEIKEEPVDEAYEALETPKGKTGKVRLNEATGEIEAVEIATKVDEITNVRNVESCAEIISQISNGELMEEESKTDIDINAVFADSVTNETAGGTERTHNKTNYGYIHNEGKQPSGKVHVENIDLMLNKTRVATLGFYDNFHLPLATKGFQFNYDKNGTKPKEWFMDLELMPEKDAEKHKKYLRKKGVLPPLPSWNKGIKRWWISGKQLLRLKRQQKVESFVMEDIKLETKRNDARNTRFQGKYAEGEVLEDIEEETIKTENDYSENSVETKQNVTLNNTNSKEQIQNDSEKGVKDSDELPPNKEKNKVKSIGKVIDDNSDKKEKAETSTVSDKEVSSSGVYVGMKSGKLKGKSKVSENAKIGNMCINKNSVAQSVVKKRGRPKKKEAEKSCKVSSNTLLNNQGGKKGIRKRGRPKKNVDETVSNLLNEVLPVSHLKQCRKVRKPKKLDVTSTVSTHTERDSSKALKAIVSEANELLAIPEPNQPSDGTRKSSDEPEAKYKYIPKKPAKKRKLDNEERTEKIPEIKVKNISRSQQQDGKNKKTLATGMSPKGKRLKIGRKNMKGAKGKEVLQNLKVDKSNVADKGKLGCKIQCEENISEKTEHSTVNNMHKVTVYPPKSDDIDTEVSSNQSQAATNKKTTCNEIVGSGCHMEQTHDGQTPFNGDHITPRDDDETQNRNKVTAEVSSVSTGSKDKMPSDSGQGEIEVIVEEDIDAADVEAENVTL